MKTLIPLTLLSILFFSACSSSLQNKVDSKKDLSIASTHNYICKSNEKISAIYSTNDSATIKYKGNIYNMNIAISGSGARYVGGDLEWWTKGTELGSQGTLLHHMSDDTSGDIIELCEKF